MRAIDAFSSRFQKVSAATADTAGKAGKAVRSAVKQAGPLPKRAEQAIRDKAQATADVFQAHRRQIYGAAIIATVGLGVVGSSGAPPAKATSLASTLPPDSSQVFARPHNLLPKSPPKPTPTTTTPSHKPAPPPSVGRGWAVAHTALNWYRWSRPDPATGGNWYWKCETFISDVDQAAGVRRPYDFQPSATAADWAAKRAGIFHPASTFSQMPPGSVVFWIDVNNGGLGHDAIYDGTWVNGSPQTVMAVAYSGWRPDSEDLALVTVAQFSQYNGPVDGWAPP